MSPHQRDDMDNGESSGEGLLMEAIGSAGPAGLSVKQIMVSQGSVH